MRIALLAVLLSCTTSLSAQILTTEVWVGTLDFDGDRFEVSELKNISNKPGYDNQPAFLPDGARLVFTTQATDLSDSGLGVHAVLHDLRSGVSTPIPDARGFSPTPSSDGRQLMLLRQGRVWLHDLSGREIRALTETDTAGYYARFDDRAYVLFMNEPERRIVMYDARTKKVETVATGALTAPYRIPGQRAVTFVAEEPFVSAGPADDAPRPQRVLRRLDMKTRTVTTLATIPFASGGHHVWTSRGTILIASGSQIYEWSPAAPEVWRPVHRAGHPDLQGITRIALSPSGDRIAFVSAPRGETVISESRRASNDALAARNVAAAAAFLGSDALVVASSGTRLHGREAFVSALTSQYEQFSDLVYVRNPDRVEISQKGDAASERGTWRGSWMTPSGTVTRGGDYMATWRRTVGDSGVPSWAIENELFVALSCEGEGCP